jgi:GT2 family glycosyltransferase
MALESVLAQIGDYSLEEKPIVILNNQAQDIAHLISIPLNKVEIIDSPIPILLPEALNWVFKLAYQNNEPWAMWLHTDAVLKSGAIHDIINKYEYIKLNNLSWGLIYECNQAFAIFNSDAIHKEQLFYDAWLFPMYYMDNHFHRILAIRGYPEYLTDTPNLVTHEVSHRLKEDNSLSRRNSLAFGLHGQLYRSIHGGPPGQEVVTDRTLGGLYPFDPTKVAQ